LRRSPAAALAAAQKWLSSASATSLAVYATEKVTSGSVQRDDAAPIISHLGSFGGSSIPIIELR
jgi:hypothetical protein